MDFEVRFDTAGGRLQCGAYAGAQGTSGFKVGLHLFGCSAFPFKILARKSTPLLREQIFRAPHIGRIPVPHGCLAGGTGIWPVRKPLVRIEPSVKPKDGAADMALVVDFGNEAHYRFSLLRRAFASTWPRSAAFW